MYHSKFRTRRTRLALIFLLVLALAGCGGDRVPVSGQVWLDEDPLAKGVIKFVPQQGVAGPQVATEIVEGNYEFDSTTGPVAGEHRVEIYVEQPITPGLDDPEEYIRLGGPQGRVQEPPNGVAPEFNVASTLTADPGDGNQSFDFRVTSVQVGAKP